MPEINTLLFIFITGLATGFFDSVIGAGGLILFQGLAAGGGYECHS
jgi:uncharacterized membrane protein YfcA